MSGLLRRIDKLKESFLDLLCPPSCSFCGELLDGKGVLCPKCLDRYAKECKDKCPTCAHTAEECRCATSLGALPDVAVTFYKGYANRGERVTEKLIYNLKREYDIPLFTFFARDTAVHIMKYLVRRGAEPSDYVMTYSPRSDVNFKNYGFDHGEEIAKRAAEYLGIPCIKALKRKGGREQKSLSSDERKQNAGASLWINEKHSVDGKRVILFDDLITTGATIGRAVELLYSSGAREVVVACIARTAKEKRRKY